MSLENFNLEEAFEQAVQLHQSGQLAEAEQLYQTILAVTPEKAPIYINLGDILVRQGKTMEASVIVKKGLELDPKNADALSLMSMIRVNMGDDEGALEYAKKVIDFYPDSADARFNMGNLLMHRGEQQEALKAFQKATELNPKLGQAHYNVGTIQYSLGNIDASIDALEQAILATPDLVQAYGNMGHVLAAVTRYDEALVYLKKAVSIYPDYELAYKNMGMVHHTIGRLDDAEENYRIALEKNPNNVETMVLMGNVLRDMAREGDAVVYYEKALAFDPENTVAQQNLKKIRKQKISSWHHTMLADSARNDAYDRALKNAVSSQTKVLDVGTGSGLLSMMAVRAGAQKVYGCEVVPEIAEVAKRVVADNGMQEKITVINKKSTSIKVGEDIPEKADLMVSEILDVGLLGEGVIPTLRHAYANLLKPDAVVIPKAADVYAVLLESDHLKQVNPIKEISGFDLSAFNEFTVTDEYSGNHLTSLPHRKLSEPFLALNVDFAALPPATSDDQPNEKQLEVNVTQDGVAHGVAFWFDLHLDDTICLSSGPDGEMIHWGQAIYFFQKEQQVKAGDVLSVKLLQSEMKITFEC